MSNPSFSNIDLWLYELNEGNLTPTQVEQLQTFLLQHPELDVDKDVWQNARLQRTEEYVYTKKASLIRGNPVFRIMDFASVAVVLTAIVTIGIFSNDTSTKSNLARVEKDALDKVEVSNNSEISEKQKSSIFNSRTASIPSVASAFSSAMNAISSSSTPLQFSSNTQAAAVTANLIVLNQNTVADRVNDENSSTGSVDNLTEPTLALNSAYDNVIPARSSGRGLIQDAELLDENNFTSNSFYEVSHMNLNGLDDELGNKDYSLMAMNKDHELNYFQKKKKTLTKYQLMMKTKAGSFGRKVMGMMNNPIALKNFRDPHYNIPGLSVSDINFSSAGSQLATRVQTLSRLQWQGKENQQLMNQLNLDGYVFAVRGGFSLQLNHSMYKNGGINVADMAIAYSPKISLSNTVSLEPSFRFKMGNKSLNHSKMDGANQLELERGVVEDYYADGSTPIGNNLWYKDFGAGVMVNTQWFFAGVQIDNVFRHKDNMYSNTTESPRRSDHNIIASAGTDWVSRNKKMSLSPYVVYQNEGELSELWVGANARLNWFMIGASFSSTRNPSATIGARFKNFSIYYNADYSKSIMTGERSLSHQVTLKFLGKQSRFGRGR